MKRVKRICVFLIAVVISPVIFMAGIFVVYIPEFWNQWASQLWDLSGE